MTSKLSESILSIKIMFEMLATVLVRVSWRLANHSEKNSAPNNQHCLSKDRQREGPKYESFSVCEKIVRHILLSYYN